MKRNAGIVTLLLMLFAGSRIAIRPPQTSAAENQTASESHGPRESLPGNTACPAFGSPDREKELGSDGKISSLVQRFLTGYSSGTELAHHSVPARVRFMFATVPDPLHTHLSMQFDRTIEALQQAMQDEGYTYDSSWLPWKTQSDPYSSLGDQKADEKETAFRELCPGMVLFRRSMSAPAKPDAAAPGVAEAEAPANATGTTQYDQGMFVFLIAETPTAGLNQIQWKNAQSWVADYGQTNRWDKVLRVLGPNFSGSMPSLVRALDDLKAPQTDYTHALLYAGRIRGCGPWKWLNGHLNAEGTLPIRTADFDENDAIQIDRFYRFIHDRGHALSELAILSEDETAYGGLPDPTPPPIKDKKKPISQKEKAAPSNHIKAESAPLSAVEPGLPCELAYDVKDRPVHLYYPRDISAIRSAYQEQSIFSSATSGEPGASARTVLQPQADSSSHFGSDSIEPFARSGVALTQEAQLYGIVNELKTHGIRYVVLRSTNSLDYLFLTRFLHRAYPDAFIVTMGTDMLFGRDVDSTEFRGVIALSAFPLLPRGQDWTMQTSAGEQKQHAHRIFGSDIMEGVYLAARFLSSDCKSTPAKEDLSCWDFTKPYQHPAKPDIPDYAEPFWMQDTGQSSASTWISVIGRDGYWPLAISRSGYGTHDIRSNLDKVLRPQGNTRPEGLFTLSSSWKFFCFMTVIAVGLHIFACSWGWDRQALAVFIQFTPLPGKRQSALMAFGWTVIGSLVAVLLTACARIYPWLRWTDGVWVWLIAVCFAGACIGALLDGRSSRIGKTEEARSQQGRSSAWGLVALVVICCMAALQHVQYSGDEGVTLAYRSVHLSSGISPLVSILLMLCGLYWWFWQALSGLSLLGRGRPLLPRKSILPKALSRISSEMAGNIENSAIPFPDWKSFDQSKRTRVATGSSSASGSVSASKPSIWETRLRTAGDTILQQWIYLLPLVLLSLQVCVMQRPWSQGFDAVLHSLENKTFNWTLHGMFAIALYLLIVDSLQLCLTWSSLKRLLLALNRLPLRRTFASLQGLSMQSLWNMSGTSSRARYTVFSHQIESLIHLRNELASTDSPTWRTASIRSLVSDTINDGMRFIETRSQGADLAMSNDADARAVRVSFSKCTEQILNKMLMADWLQDAGSLDLVEVPRDDAASEHFPLSKNRSNRLAEEFVCLIYVGYLQNMLARMRTLVLSMLGTFVTIALSVAFYPYTPRPLLALSLCGLLLLIGVVIANVYAGLDRDSTLSHITSTQPGKLGWNFWVRTLGSIGLPAIGLLVAQFPAITDFVRSWIEPTISAAK